MTNKLKINFEGTVLKVAFDANQDGQPSIELDIKLDEAAKELFQKGKSVAIEGVKTVHVGFEGGKLKVGVDTDKDGQDVVDLKIDALEVLDETGLIKSGAIGNIVAGGAKA